jgi:hypothetical protein
MELLAFGDTGWGDELFYATLMTIAVSITAMLIGFLFALIFTPLKLSKYKIFKMKPVALHFSNLFFNQQSYILKRLKQKVFIKEITSYNYFSHNGCRLKKKKTN